MTGLAGCKSEEYVDCVDHLPTRPQNIVEKYDEKVKMLLENYYENLKYRY